MRLTGAPPMGGRSPSGYRSPAAVCHRSARSLPAVMRTSAREYARKSVDPACDDKPDMNGDCGRQTQGILILVERGRMDDIIGIKGDQAVTALPNAFKRIRLNLAPLQGVPAGSSRHGYEFVAPLSNNSHIDTELWKQHRDHCRVSTDFGKARRMSTASGLQPGGRSMGAGCSTTTRLLIPMTRAVTASARMFFGRVNMYRFATKRVRCVLSGGYGRGLRPGDGIDRHAPCRESAP